MSVRYRNMSNTVGIKLSEIEVDNKTNCKLSLGFHQVCVTFYIFFINLNLTNFIHI